MKESATVLQKLVRAWHARKHVTKLRTSVVKIQVLALIKCNIFIRN